MPAVTVAVTVKVTSLQPVLLEAIGRSANGLDVVEDLYWRARELQLEGWLWDWDVIDQAVVRRFGHEGLDQIKAGLSAGV